MSHSGVFTVTMLDVLRGELQQWALSRDLRLARIPDAADNVYILVPAHVPGEPETEPITAGDPDSI